MQVLPIRVLSFERIYSLRDPDYDRPAGTTYAHKLAQGFEESISPEGEEAGAEAERHAGQNGQSPAPRPVDPLKRFRQIAVDAIRNEQTTMRSLAADGRPWGHLNNLVSQKLRPFCTLAMPFCFR